MAKGQERLKECRYCMTEISRRARVCPQCRHELSFFSGVLAFFRSAAWVVATTVSLGFAVLERAERMGLASELEVAGITLTQQEVQKEVLLEEVRRRDEGPRMGAIADEPARMMQSVDVDERIAEVENKISEVTSKPHAKLDRSKLKQLERERLQLKLSKPIR